MTRPAHSQPLSFGQRIGVLAWRGLMGVGGVLSSLNKFDPPGPITQHSYGSHPDERIEFIPPRQGAPARAPLVYIHGGGWICGKKEMYTGELLFLAEAGYPVFNVEYPLAPERPHPHMLLSLLDALAWIRAEHPERGAVHLMGDSAGGNLVVMLGILLANPEKIRDLDADFTAPLPLAQSVVSLYGVLDRLSWIEHGFPSARLMLECYAGPGALEHEGHPEAAITPMDFEFAELPPTFLSVGSADQLAESSRLCAEHLQKRFENVVYEVYEGEAHGFFNRAKRPATQRLRADILAFLERQ